MKNQDRTFGDGRGFLGNRNHEAGKSELNHEFEWESAEPEYDPDDWFDAIHFEEMKNFPIGSICYLGNPDFPLIVMRHDVINGNIELEYQDKEYLMGANEEWDAGEEDSMIEAKPNQLRKYKYIGIKMHIETGAIISVN